MRESYKKVFDTLRFAKEHNFIAPRGVASWLIACGEITIHPYRDQIMDLVTGEKVEFYTNALLFDEGIARELQNNPLATINVSLDSGTPSTYHKVKGVNKFHQVLDNLVRYAESACTPNQITIKYIVLPGINDSDEDFISLISILKTLGINYMEFSRDTAVLGASNTREQARNGEVLDKALLISASKFLIMCTTNGINVTAMHNYTPQEHQKILRAAIQIIKENSKK